MNILVLGARAITASAPGLVLGADVTLAVRRLQDIEAAARTLKALDVSPFDDELRAALDEASNALSERETTVVKDIAATILTRFGEDSQLEPVGSEDGATLLTEIILDEIDLMSDEVVVLIDGERSVIPKDRVSFEGMTLTVEDAESSTLAELDMRDVAAIALPKEIEESFTPCEILMRNGSHIIFKAVRP